MAEEELKTPNGTTQPATAEAAGDGAPETEDERDREMLALRTELDEVKGRFLRSLADLENYRKRADRLIEEERRYANLPLIRDLLPVLDNVRRAIEAAQQKPESNALLEGFQMTARQLEGVFQRYHATPIEALHKPFDPHLHEAILQQPSAEFPPNTVLQETRTGYKLHERVVRPSQVIVSTAPPGAEKKDDQEDGRA